jgi:long-chain acyl-CoA synthetase
VLVGKDPRGGDGNAAARFGGAVAAWDEALAAESSETPPRKAIDIDLAALIYTSGTTGNPKGVMMAHRNIVSASTSITTYLENRESDVVLDVLPLSFDYGLYQVIMAAQYGGTVIIEKSFLYPYAVINLIRKERVTGFPIVPTISAILLQMEELGKERFEHLRYISNTAAALPVSHITGLQKVFPGVRIYSMYGLTECKRVSYLPPEELDRRPTSVGRGMPNEQVYLVDENDNVITEPNVIGQLVVRGGNVMLGYWELPAETAKTLRPGRLPGEMVLYTGDLFKMDEEGFLYFIARGDDIIKSRGEKVSPKEVENALYSIDGVVEAVVTGVSDPVLGEAIKAYVVLRKGATLTDKDILARCAASLEDFMVPKYVEFRDELPKTSTGKITRKGL